MIFKEISLADAVEFIVDNRGKTVPVEDKGFPLIATNCVSNENMYPVFNNVRYVSDEIYDNWFRSHPLPDDILLTNKGSKNGAICLVPDPVTFCIAQDMVALRAKKETVYPRYLFAVLRSSLVQSRIKELNVDSVIPHFKKTDFNKLFFPLPDYEKQIVIGDSYFDFCFKIELNRQTNQTLEQIAQAIFKSWFIDFEPVKAKIAAKQALETDQGLAKNSKKEGGWVSTNPSETDKEHPEVTRAAMCAISGKTLEELDQLDAETQQQLKTTAALFPDTLVDSELGEIPEGWEEKAIEDIVERLKPKKRYTKKLVSQYGKIPVYEQGASILLGYHNEEPGFIASPDEPMFIFGDHTCVTHLSCSPFDISQNVVPLKGRNYPTIWVYYAVQNKQEFQEYRRHWSEFIIKDVVLPSYDLTKVFSDLVTSLYKQKEHLVNQNSKLESIRDTLLPKLLSGELALDEVG
ncbi:MAG: restriction endonuclease subunit S [Methylococcaceae bacterium]|nr:restriction endonuclease subunit S [Methylococcaceae bacterium]